MNCYRTRSGRTNLLWLLFMAISRVANPVHASVDLQLHLWGYAAIERLTALGIIDQAMVVAKPYSRKQAAKYVARAIERIRSDEIKTDGREVLAEPLLERLIAEFR